MAKKALYIAASIIEVILLIGAVVLDWTVRNYMGMARFTIARSRQLEQNLPTDVILWVCAGILIALLFVAIALFLRQAVGRNFRTWAMMVLAVAFVVTEVVFIAVFDTGSLRSYYYVVILLGITSYIQVIKAIVNEILYSRGLLKKTS